MQPVVKHCKLQTTVRESLLTGTQPNL